MSHSGQVAMHGCNEQISFYQRLPHGPSNLKEGSQLAFT